MLGRLVCIERKENQIRCPRIMQVVVPGNFPGASSEGTQLVLVGEPPQLGKWDLTAGLREFDARHAINMCHMMLVCCFACGNCWAGAAQQA